METTEEALREAGADGFELFVLWTGIIDESAFHVVNIHVPRQTSYQLGTGLCVRVDGDELHRLNCWLLDSGQLLGVQIHSHPTAAYHSDTDNTFPIVTLVGGVSIVVPDFGERGIFGRGTVAYRLERRRGWVELQHGIERLVKVRG